MMKLSLQIGFYPVAAVLLSAVASSAGFAGEQSPARNGSGSVHRPVTIGTRKPAEANVIRRNTIGLPTVPRQVIQRYNAQPFTLLQAQPLAVPASPIGSLANRGLGRTQTAVPRASPAATILIPGRIDGSSLTRPGTARASVGGPAIPVGGINGTAFRRKY